MQPLSAPPHLHNCDRTDLLNYFQGSWQLETMLWQSLRDQDTFYLSPDPLRNRLIFYLGHSAVFYLNKLVKVGLCDRRINDYYENLFEIGVDPETPEELENAVGKIEFPDVAKVWQYRQDAQELITQVIQHAPLNLPITPESPWWAFLMAVEHSWIHFETSSMLLRQLDPAKLQRPPAWQYGKSQGNAPENPLLEIPGGKVTLGKPANSSSYGWDSDYGKLAVDVKSFGASKYPITNQEYLEFVQSGGYTNREYWSDRAWQWLEKYQVQQPKFWQLQTDGSYLYRTVFELIELPLDFPVEVNYFEAMAYCRWRGSGIRLMTEAEWNLALDEDREQTNLANNYNLNFSYGSPTSVGTADNSNNLYGLQDLRGNVWQWMQDSFSSLPGFLAHPLYLDYSEPFLDEQHYVMKGGSWASIGAYASAYCRNWFRPYFYQHVGFRIAKSRD